MTTKKNDERVQAIRSNEKVGSKTLSTIEMAWTDDELITQLDDEGVATAKQAVAWALDYEGLQLEMALNARWGEDSAPELKAWEAWNE